jgi:hypothetical protein
VRVEKTAIRERQDLPLRHAINYYQNVFRNIVTQKYASEWQKYPYAQRYAEWKEAVASRMDWWRLFDALLINLRAFRVRGTRTTTAFMGGIPNDVTYGGKSIAWYGRIVETGQYGAGRKVKPRPLFKPTAEEYERKEFKEEGYKALDKIKKAWR